MKFRFLTSGESHGECLNAIIEGLPSGLEIDFEYVNNELARRQIGYGRGGRMKIETDCAVFKSGIRHSYTTGSPICLEIKNNDFSNWQNVMAIKSVDLYDESIKSELAAKKIVKVRPGHADFAGAMKYAHDDVRNILERSSARETAVRVAVGAIAKSFLKEFDIKITSHVIQIGTVKSDHHDEITFDTIKEKADANDLRCADFEAYEKMKMLIDEAKEKGVSLGGKIEILVKNVPIGLGSFVHWDRRIDGHIAQAVMSIPAVKGVSIGDTQKASSVFGSEFHDELYYENGEYHRKTNNAGGIEGGMTNGELIRIKAVMKPIPTMVSAIKSVDITTKEGVEAHVERADVCAVSACGVVSEAMVAIVLVNEFLEKFGGDSIAETKKNYANYKEMLNKR